MKCEPCESTSIEIARDPGSPTIEEIERHNPTHNPYRSWCPICVEAKGKEDPHYKSKKDKSKLEGKPTIGLDYKSFGQNAKNDDKATVIIGRDRKTMYTFAHLCTAKGPTDEWVVEQLVKDIDGLGHADLILKTDGEPALVAVQEAIKRRRTAHGTIPQHPPAYDPQSNGAIEKTVDDFMGQMRALKIGLERRLKTKIESDEAILQWMIEHSSTIINRCQMGHA